LVGSTLDKYQVRKVENGAKKRSPAPISGPGAVGNAAVYNCQLRAHSFCLGKEIRPDFRFENHYQRRTDGSQYPPHAPDIVKWRIEDAIHQMRNLPSRGFSASHGGSGQINGDKRLMLLPFSDERDGGCHFADRHGMQPEAAGSRPSERWG